MTTAIEPNSRSLILRATRILVVKIESSNAQPWTPRKPSGEERRVSLSLQIEEVPKGKVKQRPGDRVKLDVKQVRVGFSWAPMPGVWSNASIDPGARLIAFSQVDGDEATSLLDDPGCSQLIPAETALADVHLAGEAETNGLDLDSLLARAGPVAPSLGELFADWLWARFGTEAIADPGEFGLVTDLVEDSKLGKIARNALIMSLTSAIERSQTPVTQQIDRLAQALFRLLGEPRAAAHHDNIVGTDLPDLLGIASGEVRRQASEVFQGQAAARAQAEQALRAYRGSEPTAPLLDWLQR